MPAVRSRVATRLVLLSACATSACLTTYKNLAPSENLGDKKILAGRILFLVNDQPGKESEFGLEVTLRKSGKTSLVRLDPDPDGYVFAAVEPARYDFCQFKVDNFFEGHYWYSPPKAPSVTILPTDSGVNFGTIELKFVMSTADKTTAILSGLSLTHAEFQLALVPDFASVQEVLRQKFGRPEVKLLPANVVLRVSKRGEN